MPPPEPIIYGWPIKNSYFLFRGILKVLYRLQIYRPKPSFVHKSYTVSKVQCTLYFTAASGDSLSKLKWSYFQGFFFLRWWKVETIETGFFLFNFVKQVDWQSSTTGMSQIWLGVQTGQQKLLGIRQTVQQNFLGILGSSSDLLSLTFFPVKNVANSLYLFPENIPYTIHNGLFFLAVSKKFQIETHCIESAHVLVLHKLPLSLLHNSF